MYLDYKKIGRNLARRRKEMKLKQYEVCERAEINSTVCLFKNTLQNRSIKTGILSIKGFRFLHHHCVRHIIVYTIFVVQSSRFQISSATSA